MCQIRFIDRLLKSAFSQQCGSIPDNGVSKVSTPEKCQLPTLGSYSLLKISDDVGYCKVRPLIRCGMAVLMYTCM